MDVAPAKQQRKCDMNNETKSVFQSVQRVKRIYTLKVSPAVFPADMDSFVTAAYDIEEPRPDEAFEEVFVCDGNGETGTTYTVCIEADETALKSSPWSLQSSAIHTVEAGTV